MARHARRSAASGAPTAAEVPTELYEHARRRLLRNAPMRGQGERGGAPYEVLTAGEIEALESVGLSTAAWVANAARDPLMRTIADYMALLDTSLTTSQAAEYLKVDVSRIRQRVRERSLFGIEYDGERRLPRFQFERGQILPGLREVIAALPEDLNPLDVAEWFLLPNPDLELAEQDDPLSPRDWLLRGNPVKAVVDLAQWFE